MANFWLKTEGHHLLHVSLSELHLLLCSPYTFNPVFQIFMKDPLEENVKCLVLNFMGMENLRLSIVVY